MRSHISAVHWNTFDECGFAASGKSNLKTHITAVHTLCFLCLFKMAADFDRTYKSMFVW